MHKSKNLLTGLLTAAIGCCTVTAAGAAELPEPFTAEFEFLRNGKAIGEANFAFTVDGDRYLMRSAMEGTKGVASFLGVEERSESEGLWADGQPRPERFEQTVKVSFKTILTRAVFDWAEQLVLSEHKDGETTLPLSPGVLDPVSVGLAVRAGLAEEEGEWRLPMVDEDEIEEQHFRRSGREQLDTALGCLATQRVDKIRGPESTRYTRTWYADELAFVPVYITHGKTDGEHLESRIVSLTLNGKPVEAGKACP